MNNVFKDFQVTEFFDLKGSTQGRNLLLATESLSIKEEKYGKTAMKDLDFLRHFKDSIMLDEANQEYKEILGKTITFREVMEKDCSFFARAKIIDYSLLLGKINIGEASGIPTLDHLLE